ncbi:OmpA family protein [Chitinimonas koreensis]|uniref:OmpA family protein n=1 Tax=Chitinimonas koreensis TaxID=356302 RepID=UPI0003F666E4|nr:OmpA family protein [Chitinimonas koreensis]QNM98585.1 OmpA family protein [Chitinimonas koreensis]
MLRQSFRSLFLAALAAAVLLPAAAEEAAPTPSAEEIAKALLGKGKRTRNVVIEEEPEPTPAPAVVPTPAPVVANPVAPAAPAPQQPAAPTAVATPASPAAPAASPASPAAPAASPATPQQAATQASQPAAAPVRPTPAVAAGMDEGISLPIQFGLGTARLSVAAQRLLDAVAAALATPELAGATLRIEGHTDASGNPQANDRLSEARARSVRAYLQSKLGKRAPAMQAIGRGSREPVNPADPYAEENRRVRFSIVQGGRG